MNKSLISFRGSYKTITGIQTILSAEGVHLSLSCIRSRIKLNTLEDRAKDKPVSPHQVERKRATEAQKRAEMRQICMTIDAEKARIGAFQ